MIFQPRTPVLAHSKWHWYCIIQYLWEKFTAARTHRPKSSQLGRGARHVKRYLTWSLLAFGLLFSECIYAALVTYALIPLSGNLYRYTYTVSNDGSLGSGVAVELFDIDFPTDIYDENSLTIVTSSPLAASWNETILASAPGAPAVYDVFALVGGILDGGSAAGFAIEFRWLGGPNGPGPQAFAVFDPNTFALTQIGQTTAVPEPSMLLLVSTALLILALWRRMYAGRGTRVHQRQWRQLLIVLPLLVVPFPQIACAADISIDNSTLSLAGSSWVGHTEFDLSYRATIANRGLKDANGVTATLNCLSSLMVEGTLNFGTVPAGARVTCSDTFTKMIGAAPAEAHC